MNDGERPLNWLEMDAPTLQGVFLRPFVGYLVYIAFLLAGLWDRHRMEKGRRH